MFLCAFKERGKWGNKKHVFMCFQGKGEMGKRGKWWKRGKLPVTTETSFLWVYKGRTFAGPLILRT